jgi:RNase H-like domain found in reverse transcriptase
MSLVCHGVKESCDGERKKKKRGPFQRIVTLIPAERNYDIFECELLAVVKALAHWCPHLGGSTHSIKLLTDHANLTYWKHPRKVNCQVARWFTDLQDYNLEIHHVPGKTHPADMLS